MSTSIYDVIVIGSGNAGYSSAVSAIESGAKRVLILEKSDREWAGGNSAFTAGAYRTVFYGLDDVLPIVQNVTPEIAKIIDMEPYLEKDFMADLKRVTNGRSDPELAHVLVSESSATTKWLAANGIKFQLSFNRQAYKINNRYKFWGGMVLSVVDGGKGLMRQHHANALKKGVEIRYEIPVVALLNDGGSVNGVVVQLKDNSMLEIYATGGVIMCAGGFEANPAMRAQYLGPGWDLAYVRGTPFNTGDLLRIAMRDAGAKQVGNWSGCHSVAWDANAPTNRGDLTLTNQFTKSGYPIGLMFNSSGKRFVDEGVDMRNFTYAKFGKEILGQPEGIAFQVWDSEGAAWLRDEEYSPDVVERIEDDSIEGLAEKLASKGLNNVQDFITSINEYNIAVQAHRAENTHLRFDPSRKDGLSTISSSHSLSLNKTNWALSITKAPFLAVKVTCGVTFTFGGLQVHHENSAVISEATGLQVPGLFCAGEMVGGLFYGNYPGGSGLTSGAVFGRKAGRAAAEKALRVT